MRPYLLMAWFLLPVAGLAYHYGPGQQRLSMDEVSTLVAQADRLAAEEAWEDALAKYESALAKLPEDREVEGRRIRLQLAKVRMMASGLPQAHADLIELVDELRQDSGDARLLAEAEDALAQARYYLTWLMRLEGQPESTWKPEIEAARELYRHLAEQARDAGDSSATKYEQDLEAAIRLARMDLEDLQGLPLPSQ